MSGLTGPAKFLAERFKNQMPLHLAQLPAAKRLVINRLWETGIRGRLPRHYAKFFKEWEKGPEIPIHYRPKPGRFEKNEFGQVVRIQNPKIPVLYPEEFHQGLWGGEGIVKGFQEPPPTKHQPNYKPPQETYYWPKLFLGVVYSEVLNKHLEVVMTSRGQRLIDESFGLDYYLLKTPVNEVYSLLGLKIKREILLKLAAAVEQGQEEKMAAKYETWILPREEADWHGLSFNEACHKQLILERIEVEKSAIPMKQVYRKDLLDKLNQGLMDDIDVDILYHETPKDSTMTKVFKTITGKFT